MVYNSTVFPNMDQSELANNIFFLYDIALKAAFVFKLTFSGELKVHVVPDCYLLISDMPCYVLFLPQSSADFNRCVGKRY